METYNCTKEVKTKDQGKSIEKDKTIIKGECIQSIYPIFEQNNQDLIEKTSSSNYKSGSLKIILTKRVNMIVANQCSK